VCGGFFCGGGGFCLGWWGGGGGLVLVGGCWVGLVFVLGGFWFFFLFGLGVGLGVFGWGVWFFFVLCFFVWGCGFLVLWWGFVVVLGVGVWGGVFRLRGEVLKLDERLNKKKKGNREGLMTLQEKTGALTTKSDQRKLDG